MMSLPSAEAFTTGWRFSASHAALTKKLMKPSLIPWVFSNCSPNCLRIATTFERLTSLDEVSIAMEFLDCIRRCNARAHARHRHAFFRTRTRRGCACSRRRRSGPLLILGVIDQVFLGHASAAAGTGNLRWIDFFLGGDAPARG